MRQGLPEHTACQYASSVSCHLVLLGRIVPIFWRTHRGLLEPCLPGLIVLLMLLISCLCLAHGPAELLLHSRLACTGTCWRRYGPQQSRNVRWTANTPSSSTWTNPH